MKKTFFAALLSCFAFTASYAEDIIQIEPVKMATNVDIDSEECGQFVLTVTSDRVSELTGIGLDLYMPNALGFKNTYIYEGDVLPFTTDKRGNKTYKHTISLEPCEPGLQDMEGYTRYLLKVFSTSGAALLEGEENSLIYLDLGSTSEGIYPIILKNIKLAISATENVAVVPVSTSYVVVGNPTNADLALEGTIPSFVNEALASETAIGTLDLTKATASNGTFTYVDGRKVIAPEGLKGKVAYKREVSGLASICLPFAADIKAYTYSNMAGEYAIFDEVSNLAANTPAIVNANIDITVADATIGSVEGKTINSGYYLKGGNLCKVNGSAKIAPLRGCWDITAPVKGFKFNDADAILTVDANANEDIFNLNGVKLNKAQRGVNIIGGKKVMK